MSEQFWSSVVGALLGALAAGAISIYVARWVFRSEREARAKELDAEHARRDQERAEDKRQESFKLRVDAVSELLSVVRKFGSQGGFSSIPIELENATRALLLDGTEDSYIAYQWVTMQLTRTATAATAGRGNIAPQTSKLITAMLLAWVRQEEQGALRTMKTDLANQQD